MKNLANKFSINYCGKNIEVSPVVSSTGNYFMIQLEDKTVKLKSEGISKILWIEKGRGATPLAYHLGQLIEAFRKTYIDRKTARNNW